jgi:hypothetical protein
MGYRDPEWLNTALSWLHDPSRQTLLRIVALALDLLLRGRRFTEDR